MQLKYEEKLLKQAAKKGQKHVLSLRRLIYNLKE